ncbi:hypothetical protein SHELI_v1c11050 [Spiroplasma helicoides]|uniref:Uncharacterized protein n=1 Tax=Spiroplasma helicoides TaxID=216938 RepID=A0A1B3SM97_9MOLU|nr:hypothetical protein [Spiroplasma helicoides]AOG61052.1 hypothetical protein SHELI_v1c11050 [Spiroplasma helicoides]
MSYSIKNARFVNKKVIPPLINFEVNSGNMTTIVSSEAKLLKQFKKILEGRYLVDSGTFKVDGYDKVNRLWTKKKLAIIKAGNRFFRKWPEKFWLHSSLLFNKDFYNQAKINYYNTKFSYLSFATSKSNKTDLEMRDKVDKMVEKFISNSCEIEEQWLNEFLKQIISFNENKLNDNIDEISEHILIILKDYYYLVENNNNLELLQTFLQSLWDKVYSFIDLNSLCTCQYKAKKSKDKKVRKKAKELSFKQHNFVIRKQLKIIDLKISTIKRKLSKNRFTINGLKKQIFFELSKVDNQKYKKFRKIDDMFSWRQLSIDQRFEFKQKQEKMFFEGLSDESTMIRGKIVEIIHKYHQSLLSGEVEFGNKKNFNKELKEYKSKIETISKQATIWINSTVEELGMNFSLGVKTFKVSALYSIYLKILESIYLKKYNIILYNSLSNLSKTDYDELINVLKNLKIINKKFCVIFMEKNLENIYDLKQKLFLVEEAQITELSFDMLLKSKWNTFGSGVFHNKNRIPYSYNEKHLFIFNDKIKTTNSKFHEKGQLLLNPLSISTSKRKIEGQYIEVKGKVQPTTEFRDEKVYQMQCDDGHKLFFYSSEKIESKKSISVYFSEDAILEIL